MWGDFLSKVLNWFGKMFTSTSPQRADFESVNLSWKEVCVILKKRIDDMELEFQAYRKYTQGRIGDLETEATECRKLREGDLDRMSNLELMLHKCQLLIAKLRAKDDTLEGDKPLSNPAIPVYVPPTPANPNPPTTPSPPETPSVPSTPNPKQDTK